VDFSLPGYRGCEQRGDRDTPVKKSPPAVTGG